MVPCDTGCRNCRGDACAASAAFYETKHETDAALSSLPLVTPTQRGAGAPGCGKTGLFPVCYGAGLRRCHAEAELLGRRVEIVSALPESARPFVDERT